MANRIRKELRDKIDIALAAAREKEGQEVKRTQITKEEYERLTFDKDKRAYKCPRGCLLYDGRLIQKFEGEEGKLHWGIYENLPVATIEALVIGDHDEMVDLRKAQSYADIRYEYFRKQNQDEESDDYGMRDPMDELAYARHYRPEENAEPNYYVDEPDIFLMKKMGLIKAKPVYYGGDYPPITKDDPLIIPDTQITSYGTFDEETKFQTKRVACEFIHSLDDDDKEYFLQIFGTQMKQKEVAKIRGVSEQAISNRKVRFIEAAKEYFTKAGFGYLIPEKKELKKEKSVAARYKKHEEEAQSAIREELFPNEVWADDWAKENGETEMD